MEQDVLSKLNESDKFEKLSNGAAAFRSLLLAELFDTNGARVYLYEIFGYEHSSVYVSRQKLEKQDIEQVLQEYYRDLSNSGKTEDEWEEKNNIRKIYDENEYDVADAFVEKMKKEQGIDEKINSIRGKELRERLFSKLGMLEISCEQKVFDDGFRLKK